MSHELIGRSPDLRRLRNEGYGVSVVDGALVVAPVPFLDADGAVQEGALVCDLDLSGDRTSKPGSHVAYFAGGTPHDASGGRLAGIINGDRVEQKGGRTTSHLLSSKPGPAGYPDYHSKVTTYATAISSHAEAVDDTATARCFPPMAADEGSGPFAYVDTASSRAGVDTAQFRSLSIAIIGLGGTGVYVLDSTSKTPVAKIGLYDGGLLLQHNAFRAPGVVTFEQLTAAKNKAEHWAEVYGEFHTGIVAYPYRIDQDNVQELDGYDFVFICVDDNEARHLIAKQLVAAGVAFIDTGLGLYRTDDQQLGGLIRTTTGTPARHDHLADRLPHGAPDDDPEYTTNIQIAELNALNAVLAVIRWKKTLGFYADQEHEHHSCYTITGNVIINEELD